MSTEPGRSLEELLQEVLRWEILRFKIATISVIVVGLCASLLTAYLLYSGRPVEWQTVVIAVIAAVCFALPLFKKVDVKKDGGGAEFGSPLEQIKALIAEEQKKAEAARTEAFNQTSQQVGALATKLEEFAAAEFEGPPHLKAQKETRPAEPTLAQIKRRLPPPTVTNDEQKGRFGGREEVDGRRLIARVKPSAINKEWLTTTLRVESTNGKPLEGAFVYFFVHESFNPNAFRVAVDKSGEFAELEVLSYGAYTVGAVADRGRAMLELDLATSRSFDAPDWWRKV